MARPARTLDYTPEQRNAGRRHLVGVFENMTQGGFDAANIYVAPRPTMPL